MLTGDDQEVDDLLGSADRELRRAKARGKDRWESAPVQALIRAS